MGLTREQIDRAPFAAKGQYTINDEDEPGLHVVVGTRSKAWTLALDVRDAQGRRRTRRKVVGKWPAVGIAQARRLARQARQELSAAPVEPVREPTLGDAWSGFRAEFLAAVAAGKRQGTTLDYYDAAAKHAGDWLDLPLGALSADPALVRERFSKLPAGSGNSLLKWLRRVYGWALDRRLAKGMDGWNPANAAQLNPTRVETRAMSREELRPWWLKLQDLSPVRREFTWLCLLTGSRAGALAVAEWSHLDVRRRVWRIPRPKGGEGKAYDIPLSLAIVQSLRRVRDAGRFLNEAAARRWIFPADIRRSTRRGGVVTAGHLVEWREDRGASLPYWGHDLRRSYRTAAVECRVSTSDVMVLMNHGNTSISDRYINRAKLSERQMRAEQEKISRHFLKHCTHGDPFRSAPRRAT